MDIAATITVGGSGFAPILFQGNIAQEIERAGRLGFSAVELHIRDPRQVDGNSLRDVARRAGVRVSTLGTGQAYVDDGLELTSENPSVIAEAVQRIRDQIDLGKLLGAKVIIGTIRGLLPTESAEQENVRNQVVNRLQDCCDYAASQGVILALEAINRYETNFLNTAQEVIAFLDRVDSHSIGVHLDTFHMNIEERSLVDAIHAAGDRLVHVHLADSNRRAPGWGHIDFSSVIGALRDVGYFHALGIECLPLPSFEKAAAQALAHIGPLAEHKL